MCIYIHIDIHIDIYISIYLSIYVCVFNKIFSYIKFSHSGAAGKFIQPSLQPGTFAAWGFWRRTSWPARRSRARQAQSRGQAVLSRRKPRHIPTQCRRYSNAQTLAAEAAHQDPGSSAPSGMRKAPSPTQSSYRSFSKLHPVSRWPLNWAFLPRKNARPQPQKLCSARLVDPIS